MRGTAIGVLAAGLVMAVGPAAQAMDPRCQDVLAGAAPTFDDASHRNWYARFWTGRCSGVLFCQPGSPNWREVIDRAAAEGDAATLTATCRLGRRLGHEWARDNGVRRIDTNDLRRYHQTLNGSTPFRTGLAEVARQVEARLTAR
ncbi:hypothetical protein [Brevundimonas diminuta]|uniref:hypothetical protein n=1 Tax=Brevundimonas diminuta TaxID=293 RepID=UPI0032092127